MINNAKSRQSKIVRNPIVTKAANDLVEASKNIEDNRKSTLIGNGKRQRKQKRPFILSLVTVLLIITAVASAAIVLYTGRQEYKMRNTQRIISQQAKVDKDGISGIDWAMLLEQNPDCAGWMKIDKTKVDFPLVQATFEKPSSWWLYKDFWGEYSTTGCIMVDEYCSMASMSILIAGHRTRFGNEMFNDLAWNHEQDSFDSMGDMSLSTPDGKVRTFRPLCASMRSNQWRDAQEETFETFDEMKNWLHRVYDEADAKVDKETADEIISGSKQVIVTYCCSSVFYNSWRRTYTFWVCDEAPSIALQEMNEKDWSEIPDRNLDLAITESTNDNVETVNI